MEKSFYQDLAPELRLRALQDDAKDVITEKFYEPLDPNQRENQTRTLLKNLEDIDATREEAKQAAKDFKETIDSLTERNRQIRAELRSGVAEVDGKLAHGFVLQVRPDLRQIAALIRAGMQVDDIVAVRKDL